MVSLTLWVFAASVLFWLINTGLIIYSWPILGRRRLVLGIWTATATLVVVNALLIARAG